MELESQRKLVEPFTIFGEKSIIWSSEEAKKVAKENSYYFIVFGSFFSVICLAQITFSWPSNFTKEYFIYYFIMFTLVAILGLFVKYKISRAASILLFCIFGFGITLNVVNSGWSNGMLIGVLLLAASFRATKASFLYRKYLSENK